MAVGGSYVRFGHGASRRPDRHRHAWRDCLLCRASLTFTAQDQGLARFGAVRQRGSAVTRYAQPERQSLRVPLPDAKSLAPTRIRTRQPSQYRDRYGP